MDKAHTEGMKMTHMEEAVQHFKHGDLGVRINVILTLVLWFAIGAFLTTTIAGYFDPGSSILFSLAGGLLGALVAVLLKRL